MTGYTFPWDAAEYARAMVAIGRHMRTSRGMQVFWWVLLLVFGFSVALILAWDDDPVRALMPIVPWLALFWRRSRQADGCCRGCMRGGLERKLLMPAIR